MAEARGLSSRIDIHMGTCSKAMGALGGYVAGDRRLIDYLHNRARSFIYSTALPPPVLGAIGKALEIIENEPERRAYLLGEAARFRQALAQAGLDTLGSESQIVPVLAGDNARTLAFAARLREEGLMAVALRPPTVPPGKARVRFSLSAAHSEEDLARARETIVGVARGLGLAS